MADEDYPIVLTAAECCDVRACGAQARVRVYLPSLRYLNFCKHHADAQPDILFEMSEYVIDERHLILGGT